MAQDHRKPAIDLTTNSLLVLKNPGHGVQQLALALASPRNADIREEAKKGINFPECIGIIAARLDILLDAEYSADDIDALCLLLVDRLLVRGLPESKDFNDPRLIEVEVEERQGEVHILPLATQELLRAAKKLEVEGTTDAPYTICNSCEWSFDCCLNRSCHLDKEVDQLPSRKQLRKFLAPS